jgi:hypothetical protein
MNEITQNNKPQELQINTPDNLLAIAVKNGADVDQLEKLMALKERFDAGESKKMFYSAMKTFQSRVPAIKKKTEVSFGATKYSFAPLSDIAEQIRGTLHECGLSYRFEQNHEAGIEVACIVTHDSGHSERTTMKAPADASGKKNEIQSIASTVSYLQRYTLISAFGLTTADDDIDGHINVSDELEKNKKQIRRMLAHNEAVKTHLESLVAIKEALANDNFDYAAECYAEIDEEDRISLSLAPTKGGIFTLEESKKFYDDRWSEASRKYRQTKSADN